MADYDSQTYWRDRLQSEAASGFEWLPDGMQALQDAVCAKSPRLILHLGPGSSRLSQAVLAKIDTADICSVDFAPRAYPTCQRDSFFQANLLDWESLQPLRARLGRGADVVMDKSTADAVSTFEHVTFELQDSSSPSTSDSIVYVSADDPLRTAAPPIAHRLLKSPSKRLVIPAIHLLSIHVHCLTAPSAHWYCLSYSSARADDMAPLWKVARDDSIGVKEAFRPAHVHTPTIFHHLYELIRADSSSTGHCVLP